MENSKKKFSREHLILAREMQISPNHLQRFIDTGQMREAEQYVRKESLVVLEWMRTVCGPMSLRPVFPLHEIASLLGYKLPELRKFCARRLINVHSDEIFGELVSAREFLSIRKAIENEANPLRLDRQNFLNVLMAINRTGKAARIPNRPYIERLETEIRRIANMRDPQRTMAATKLWLAYNDAAVMADTIVKAEGLRDNEKDRAKIITMMYRLRRAIDTPNRWEALGIKLSKRNKIGVVKLAKEAFAAEIRRRNGEPDPVSPASPAADSSASVV